MGYSKIAQSCHALHAYKEKERCGMPMKYAGSWRDCIYAKMVPWTLLKGKGCCLQEPTHTTSLFISYLYTSLFKSGGWHLPTSLQEERLVLCSQRKRYSTLGEGNNLIRETLEIALSFLRRNSIDYT